MLLEIQKTEMIEVELSNVKYVQLAGRSYFRFTPVNDTIEVLNFSMDVNDIFKLHVRKGIYEHEIPILNVTAEYAQEITEDEFNTTLQEQLLKHI